MKIKIVDKNTVEIVRFFGLKKEIYKRTTEYHRIYYPETNQTVTMCLLWVRDKDGHSERNLSMAINNLFAIENPDNKTKE